MNTVKQKSNSLKWETFITHRGSLTRDAPAGKEHLKWVPNTVTLISGEKDAVLVDVFLTIGASKQLVDWVVASGKSLTMIYITHAHGDHFFGLQPVLDRFPQARVIARPEVVEAMRQHISPESIEGFWNKLFPGQIAERLHVAEALDGDRFELEGHSLIAVGVGHTDTDNTTCLHIPSIHLVVAGDAVYNGVHLYLGETDATGRRDWIAALDKIAALRPAAVIAGHKAPGTDDEPRIIAETRKYIEDFDRLCGETSNAGELYSRMLDLHSNRLNPGSLWTAAKAAKPA
jgi:glyoxylase-like metal-dependent hydrolase (beta-lactamase superfamily II)